MSSVVLFVSGGEIFVILLAILIFFGADKIPEFARMMGKGVREFKKATDDIKRELNENTSGVMDDIKSIRDDMTDTLTKEISEPMQQTADETATAFEDYKNAYNTDYYYDNQAYATDANNEFRSAQEADTTSVQPENAESTESDTKTTDA